MGTKFFTFSALTAALLVSGCSSSGSGSGPSGQSIPQPSGPALGFNAAVVSANGGGNLATGQISGTTENVVIDVDGDRYRFGDGTLAANYAGVDLHSYGSGPSGAALYVGEHTAAALVADNAVNDQLASVFQGQRTPTDVIPNQQALYDGLWNIGANDGSGGANGRFAADFNFNNNTYAMGLTGNNGTTGQGSGTIDRGSNTFRGDVITQGGFVSNNDVYGAFFGPNREEIGGTMAGNSTTGETTGVFVGSQR